MAREKNQRKADQGWIQRSLDAAEHARQAGGLPPNSPGMPPGPGLPRGGPIKVSIVEGQQQFFDSLRKAFGITGTDGKQGGGAQGSDDLKAMMESGRAIAEAAKQISQDVKTFATMVMDTHTRSTQQSQSMADLMKEMNKQNQEQMTQLINLFNGGPGGIGFGGIGPGGWGGGGGSGGPGDHGGGHGGGVGYNSQRGKYESYGGIQGRFRASAANWAQNLEAKWANHPDPRMRYGAALAGRSVPGLAGGGIMGGLGRLPVVGGAIAAGEGVNTAAEWLTGERAQNAAYQSIYAGENTGGFADAMGGIGSLFNGGSTDSRTGLTNRMAEMGYTLSNRFSAGGMTGQQASQAFQGVSQLGYTGAKRDQNLGFISSAYKDLGIGPDESLQYNQLQAQYGVSNLDALYKSLQNVSKAAAATSQSAESLRKTFIGNYQSALQGGNGASANTLAGAMTMMTANNRNLAGVTPGAGILTDPALQYAASSMVGATPGQLQSAATGGNPLPQLAAQQALTSSMMQQAITPSLSSTMNQLFQEKGGKAAVKSSQGAQREIADKLRRNPDWNAPAMGMMLRMAGYAGIDEHSDPLQIAQAVVDYQSGNDFNDQARGIQQQNSLRQDSGGSDLMKKMQADVTTEHDKQYNPMKASNFWSSAGDTILGAFGVDTRRDSQKAVDSRQEVLDNYKGIQKTGGGFTDPAIEAAIQRFGNDPNTKIKVQAKGGDRVVSLADAIKYYPDQLSKGTAFLASKDPTLNDQNIGSVTGVQDVGLGPTADSSKTQDVGTPIAQWKKDNPVDGAAPAAGNGGGQSVTINLGPGVAQYFKVNVDQAAANNVPPAVGPP